MCFVYFNLEDQDKSALKLFPSDVISLHCNLTPENTGLINRENLAKMK